MLKKDNPTQTTLKLKCPCCNKLILLIRQVGSEIVYTLKSFEKKQTHKLIKIRADSPESLLPSEEWALLSIKVGGNSNEQKDTFSQQKTKETF